MLALMYRVKNPMNIFNPPVGIVEVEIQGVSNYDVSSLVTSHGEYCVAVKDILALIGFNQPGEKKERK